MKSACQVRFAALAVMLGAVLCGGCATIAHGWKQDVMVLSDPTGADVFVGSRQVGITPVRLTLNRRSRTVLRFEKDGFASTEIPLKRSADGWLAADVAVALNPFAAQGLDSEQSWPAMAATVMAELMAIDWATGAAYKLPKSVLAVLKKELPPLPRPGPGDQIRLPARLSWDRPR